MRVPGPEPKPCTPRNTLTPPHPPSLSQDSPFQSQERRQVTLREAFGFALGRAAPLQHRAKLGPGRAPDPVWDRNSSGAVGSHLLAWLRASGRVRSSGLRARPAPTAPPAPPLTSPAKSSACPFRPSRTRRPSSGFPCRPAPPLGGLTLCAPPLTGPPPPALHPPLLRPCSAPSLAAPSAPPLARQHGPPCP